MATQTVARNDLSRAFLFEEGLDVCCPTPHYFPCLSVDGLSQDFGDVTRIECPDPYNYGRYIEVAQLPGEISRMTTTLSTRLSRTELSIFRNMAVKGCGFDMHLHFGLCQKPNEFNKFDKAMIFEDVYVTNYGTDPLSALQSSDRDGILETIDITIGNYYEIVPLNYVTRDAILAATLTPVIDSVLTSYANCGGECENADTGCSDAFSITSDGTLLWTRNGGQTWTEGANDWDGAAVSTNVGLGYLNGYLWTFLNDANLSYVYETPGDARLDTVPVTKDGITGNPDEVVLTDLDSGVTIGLVVGEGGFIGVVTNPANGFDSTTLGVYTVNNLNKVSFAPRSDRGVAVGDSGTVITYNDETLTALDTSGSVIASADLTAGLFYSDKKILVGDDQGNIYCTSNPYDASAWTAIGHPLSGAGDPVTDIVMVTKHVLYAAVGADVIVSYDGGCTWSLITDNAAASNLNAAAVINDILVCPDDANHLILVGALSTAGYFGQGYA